MRPTQTKFPWDWDKSPMVQQPTTPFCTSHFLLTFYLFAQTISWLLMVCRASPVQDDACVTHPVCTRYSSIGRSCSHVCIPMGFWWYGFAKFDWIRPSSHHQSARFPRQVATSNRAVVDQSGCLKISFCSLSEGFSDVLGPYHAVYAEISLAFFWRDLLTRRCF